MDEKAVQLSLTNDPEEGAALLGGVEDPKIRESIQQFKQLVESQYDDLGGDKWYSRLAAFPVDLQMSQKSNVLDVAERSGNKEVVSQGPDMKTANAARAGSAAGASGGVKNMASQPASATNAGATTNVWVIVDVFLTLTQKLGLWIYNLVPNLPVSLTGLTLLFSWLEFPALGWELAFTLPDLSKRGYLYWIMLLFGLCLPFYLSMVIVLDEGKVPVYIDSNDASVVIEGTNRAEKMVSIFSLLLGVALIGSGAGIGNGELLGLGVLTLLFAMVLFFWTRVKASTFERELSKHNRRPAPAYRGMRVFVCSKLFLVLLRGMYIFTISALCQTIMASIGDSSRNAETGIAILFLIPTVLVPPIAIYMKGRSFYAEHIEPQSFDKDSETGYLEYRGWLERFAVREHDTSMLDITMAELLLPFQPNRWYYAVVQLLERAFATMFATFLVQAKGQLALAIVIESGAGLLEWQFTPFTDDTEDTFNLRWRMIASTILLLLLLVELIGEPFAVAGDVLLVLLVFLAWGFFFYAIDIPRIVRKLRLNAAVNKFRQHKLEYAADSIPNTDIVTVGDLAIEDIPENLDLGSNLASAFAAVPGAFEAGEVVRDAWSFTQQYRVLSRADGDLGALREVMLRSAMWRVEPIVSLYGSQLGGPIPSCIGAYGNVTKLILTDMGLDDTCSLEPLQAMTRLELLVLDGNLFEHTIPGLEGLRFKKFSLSLANLHRWSGAGNQALVEALSRDRGEGTQFVSLNLEGSNGFADPKAPVTMQFVEFLGPIRAYTTVKGKKVDRGFLVESHKNNSDTGHPPLARMSEQLYKTSFQKKLGDSLGASGTPDPSRFADPFTTEMESRLTKSLRELYTGYFDDLGFEDEQYRRGGVELGVLRRLGLFTAERSGRAGFSLRQMREAGYTVGCVKDLGEFGMTSAKELREAGYPVKEILAARSDLDEFELERGGFTYKEMAQAGIKIAQPPLSISLIKLKDSKEVQTLTAEDLARMGYSYDDFTSSGIEREVSFSREDYRAALHK